MSMFEDEEERLEPLRVEEHESPEHKKFYDCILQGTVEEIKEWNKDNMYNVSFKNGLSPIHVAAMSGRDDEMEDIITILLKGGADVNAKTASDHNTVLHLLIKHNHISVAFPGVVAALEYYPDVHWRNRHLRTAYDIAVAREYFDIATCVDGTMMPADARALYGKSVGIIYGKRLMKAILNNDEDDAILSVKKGANCNILNDHGCAAIHYVFTVYELPPMPLVTAMHQMNADLNITDNEGDTALNLCIKSRPMRLSGQMNNMVAALIRWGALSTYKDLDGKDALAVATDRNYNDIVRLLKKDRAQHILDMEEMEEKEMLQAGLKDHNDDDDEDKASSVSLGFEDDDQSLNESALEELAEGDDEFMAILNDPDADVNQPNELGLYPIHLAVMNTDANKRKTIIKLLMDKGADINIQALEDDDHDQETDSSITESNSLYKRPFWGGNTPLHIAAWRNHLVSVKQILSYKPEYNKVDSDGKTARDIAEENGFTKIVDLIDKYAKIAEKWNEPEKKSKSCIIL
ncbi:serine/threonine-protein phosphatase 6 regulatory ankyrin repeat subunit B-like isoform X7 [Pecten maximus]|uniref:serine/threonine-protein phosphatase 6 regulatory ankyrin repeat subunit B-like isoform X7 n=1 Tax=Pecten maximus TaxID=6579 RepID=UPI001458ED7A|nr:serine/threonine-protein phosphatase 6 regulatory ankyrin repeat subunit B-like isoform X7 [Pecten maximus]